MTLYTYLWRLIFFTPTDLILKWPLITSSLSLSSSSDPYLTPLSFIKSKILFDLVTTLLKIIKGFHTRVRKKNLKGWVECRTLPKSAPVCLSLPYLSSSERQIWEENLGAGSDLGVGLRKQAWGRRAQKAKMKQKPVQDVILRWQLQTPRSIGMAEGLTKSSAYRVGSWSIYAEVPSATHLRAVLLCTSMGAVAQAS